MKRMSYLRFKAWIFMLPLFCSCASSNIVLTSGELVAKKEIQRELQSYHNNSYIGTKRYTKFVKRLIISSNQSDTIDAHYKECINARQLNEIFGPLIVKDKQEYCVLQDIDTSYTYSIEAINIFSPNTISDVFFKKEVDRAHNAMINARDSLENLQKYIDPDFNIFCNTYIKDSDIDENKLVPNVKTFLRKCKIQEHCLTDVKYLGNNKYVSSIRRTSKINITYVYNILVFEVL